MSCSAEANSEGEPSLTMQPERETFKFYDAHRAIWAEGESARKVKTAAEALAKIMDNILEKPSILKYRRLPANGTAFVSRVVACPGALEVLKNVTVHHSGIRMVNILEYCIVWMNTCFERRS